MLLAAIKQREVDERIELTDADVLAIIDKMIKQRRDSITQFEAGKREDLAAAERAEIALLGAYLPTQLGEAEIDAHDRRGDRRDRRRRACRHGQGDGGRSSRSSPDAPTWRPSSAGSRRSSPGRRAGATPAARWIAGRRSRTPISTRPPFRLAPRFAYNAVVPCRVTRPEARLHGLPDVVVRRDQRWQLAPASSAQVHDSERFHTDAAVPGRHRRRHRPLRPAQEGRRQLQRLLPVPQREDAVVHGEPVEAVLPLLRLRRARHGDRLPDGVRRQGVSRCGRGARARRRPRGAARRASRRDRAARAGAAISPRSRSTRRSSTARS